MTDAEMVSPATSQPAETNRDRVSRRQVDKFAERRAQLADAANLEPVAFAHKKQIHEIGLLHAVGEHLPRSRTRVTASA